MISFFYSCRMRLDLRIEKPSPNLSVRVQDYIFRPGWNDDDGKLKFSFCDLNVVE